MPAFHMEALLKALAEVELIFAQLVGAVSVDRRIDNRELRKNLTSAQRMFRPQCSFAIVANSLPSQIASLTVSCQQGLTNSRVYTSSNSTAPQLQQSVSARAQSNYVVLPETTQSGQAKQNRQQ